MFLEIAEICSLRLDLSSSHSKMIKKTIIIFIILILLGFACSSNAQNHNVRREKYLEIPEKQSAHHEYPHMSIDLLK